MTKTAKADETDTLIQSLIDSLPYYEREAVDDLTQHAVDEMHTRNSSVKFGVKSARELIYKVGALLNKTGA